MKTMEEILEIEKVTNESIKRNVACCADMGICEHDPEYVAKLKAEHGPRP